MSNRFIGSRQTTVAREIELTGTGVHSGAPASVILHPAEADAGLRFLVTNRGRVISDIEARVDNVKNLTLCTVIGDNAGNTVSTVEHLLAALRGLSYGHRTADPLPGRRSVRDFPDSREQCRVRIGLHCPLFDGSAPARA